MPPGVVTLTGPVLAPDGTIAVIWLSEFTVNCALWPLNEIAEAAVKCVPTIKTVPPTGPLLGVNDAIVGAGDGNTENTPLSALPPEVTSAIGPDVAFRGTVACNWYCEFTVTLAAGTGTPLNCTVGAVPKFVPLIMITAPIEPLAGVMLAIIGAETVNGIEAMPPAVATASGPDVACAGTTTSSALGETKIEPADGSAGTPLKVTWLVAEK